MEWEKNLNALLIVALAGILTGAFGIQVFEHEQPCPLCYLQRLGMLGVATGALLNIRFGIRRTHYGLSLLASVFGGFVALRQIALHVCPDFPKFGKPFWGLSLYTWSFITFASIVTYIALLLIFFKNSHEKPEKINGWCKFAFAYIFLIAFTNIITSFVQCGFGLCEG